MGLGKLCKYCTARKCQSPHWKPYYLTPEPVYLLFVSLEVSYILVRVKTK